MPHGTLNTIWSLRRGSRPMSQAELARLAGVRQSRLAEYESGRRVPALRRAIEIAVALGRPVEVVFFELYEAACEQVGRRLASPSVNQAEEDSEAESSS